MNIDINHCMRDTLKSTDASAYAYVYERAPVFIRKGSARIGKRQRMDSARAVCGRRNGSARAAQGQCKCIASAAQRRMQGQRKGCAVAAQENHTGGAMLCVCAGRAEDMQRQHAIRARTAPLHRKVGACVLHSSYEYSVTTMHNAWQRKGSATAVHAQVKGSAMFSRAWKRAVQRFVQWRVWSRAREAGE